MMIDDNNKDDASAFSAGQIENWHGWVELCVEHIEDICFGATACLKKLVSLTVMPMMLGWTYPIAWWPRASKLVSRQVESDKVLF